MGTRASVYPDRLPRDVRRRMGCYYTPARIVSHLVARVLDPLLPALRRAAAAGSLDEALSLRLLDPAMGDGAFLAAAADRIAQAVSEASGRPLPEVRRRVVARCLHGVDIDPVAVRLAREALGAGAASADLTVGDSLADGPMGRPADGFDVVIGNPPWGGWNRRLDPAARRAYRDRFATARGLIEPSVLFLERCADLLRHDGRLAFVLPDYLLLKNYPAARARLLDRFAIEELAHWGRAFDGVNLDAFSLVARRARRRQSSHAVRCLPDGPGGRILKIPQRRFEAAPGHVFNLSLDEASAALLGRLDRDCARLGDWIEAHEGIHSGNIRPKLFVPPGGPRDGAGGSLRPLILGRDEVRPFSIRWSGWKVRYDRKVIDRGRGEYASLGDPCWFRGPKLLVRRTGDHVLAAVDTQGRFASNNLFVAFARPGCPVPLAYIEGFLNSSLATWCFRAIQPRAGRIFAELKLAHLRRLPVPLPPDRAHVGRVQRIVSRLRRPGAPRDRDRGESLAALDEVFASLAGLTEADRRRVAAGSTRGRHSL